MPQIYPKRYSAKGKRRMIKRYRSAKKALGKNQTRAVKAIVNKTLNRVLETKESTRNSTVNVGLPHNNVYTVLDSLGGSLNPFTLALGTGDPHAAGTGNRIGDNIVAKGLLIKGMLEGALQRSKVHFKVMLLKAPIGASFARADIFKGNSNNKLLDQINTERYTVVKIIKFNVSPPESAPATVQATGVTSGAVTGVTGNKVFSMWIPGKYLGYRGKIQYENGSTTQIKNYDYRLIILAYDWYGTPQDVNNVGILNEIYTKLYFKDA